jgi:hypothetical protein
MPMVLWPRSSCTVRMSTPAITRRLANVCRRQCQPQPYKAHLDWVKNLTPEAVRVALLACRNRRMQALSDFEEALAEHSKGLTQPRGGVS